MIRQKWPTFLICVAFFALMVVFALGASPLVHLVLVVLALAWCITLIGNIGFAIKRWKDLRLKALVPLTICLLTLPVASVIGRVTETLHFRYWLLPRFEQVVAQIKTTNVLRGAASEVIASDVARIVIARRNEENQFQVEFVTGLGFPVKHSGYLFVENEDIESDSFLASRWPHATKVKPSWFRVAD